MVTTLAVGDKVISRALALPPDGTIERTRREQHQRLFRVKKDFHPEAPTDVGGDDVKCFGRQLEDVLRELVAQHVWPLRRCVQTKTLAIPRAQRCARLDGIDDDAVVDDLMFHDTRCPFEGGVSVGSIALLPMEADVPWGLRPDLRDTRFGGGASVDDCVQIFVVHRDELSSGACDTQVFGDDHGHGLADMAHDTVGQEWPRRRH